MCGGRENYLTPQPDTPVRPPLAIVADDLTGACDAAVAFTAACDPVRVQILEQPAQSACVHAITTESRNLSPADATARIRSIVQRLPEGAELFKKVDSVFRGNTVAEIASTLRYSHFDLAILAPAYPALERIVRQGVLHISDAISDAAGNRIVPLAELLISAGCPLTSLSGGMTSDALTAAMRRCLSSSASTVLFDAATQDELTRIVQAARSLDAHILWIGSGGLAHALAAELPALPARPPANPRPGHTLFFIGSPHTVTKLQVEHLRDSSHASVADQIIPIVLGETTADDIRRSVASHKPSDIGCLFMTGGDTAHFICRALGINALRLQREFAPGVPLAVAEGGPCDGVSVVLKSGGFGDPDLLCRLLETCRPEVIA